MADAPNPSNPVRGPDLRAERVRRGLTQADVAVRIGLSRTRIVQIEATWRPRPAMIIRYLEAIGDVE